MKNKYLPLYTQVTLGKFSHYIWCGRCAITKV